MKINFKKNSSNFYTLIMIVCITVLMSCRDSKEIVPEELTIEQKIVLLEKGEWLLKGFEDRVMHTFKQGKEHIHYSIVDGEFLEAIPGTHDYIIEGNLLTMDFHFGHVYSYELKFSCDNNIVQFFRNGELNKTFYKRGSNYKQCL